MRRKRYEHHCRKCKAAYCRRWREADPKRYRKSLQRSYAKHRERRAVANKAWRASPAGKAYEEKHRAKRNTARLQWAQTEKGKTWLRAYNRRYRQERAQRDISFRLGLILRARIRDVFRGKAKKSGSAICLLGATFEQVREHIEKQWLPGMSWENHGHTGTDKWHIDHVIPIAAFDITDPEQQRKAFHYSNLRPCWAHENFSKNDRVMVNGKLVQARRLPKGAVSE